MRNMFVAIFTIGIQAVVWFLVVRSIVVAIKKRGGQTNAGANVNRKAPQQHAQRKNQPQFKSVKHGKKQPAKHEFDPIPKKRKYNNPSWVKEEDTWVKD